MIQFIVFITTFLVLNKYASKFTLSNYLFFDVLKLKYPKLSWLLDLKVFYCEACSFFWVYLAVQHLLGFAITGTPTDIINIYSLIAFLIKKVNDSDTIKL